MENILIAPSILAADFGKLNVEINSIENCADWIHIDVMDGHFVPNITFGPGVLKSIKTNLFKDCHLMISEPIKYLEKFITAGADGISFHIETEDIIKSINIIKSFDKKVGLALKPSTDVKNVFQFLDKIDFVLIMSVEPGFGGQKFMPEVLDKVKILKKLRPSLMIQIDGGIDDATAKHAIKAGVNNLVAGSYIFKSVNRAESINNLRIIK